MNTEHRLESSEHEQRAAYARGASDRGMHVRIISFGTNWWVMYPRDPDQPCCLRRRPAWFNSTGLKYGRRLRISWIYPGQIRFNLTSGFDPGFKMRAIGKTFLCSGPNRLRGKSHLLFVRPAKSIRPDAYLVTFNSAEHGPIHFTRPDWKSRGVVEISVSLRGVRYEAMLLMAGGSWIQSEWGRWQMIPDGNCLVLAESGKGALQ